MIPFWTEPLNTNSFLKFPRRGFGYKRHRKQMRIVRHPIPFTFALSQTKRLMSLLLCIEVRIEKRDPVESSEADG